MGISGIDHRSKTLFSGYLTISFFSLKFYVLNLEKNAKKRELRYECFSGFLAAKSPLDIRRNLSLFMI